MPRRLPPHVERNHVKGHTYLSFRIGKGPRVRLPDDPASQEFHEAYAAALAGDTSTKPAALKDKPGTIGALIASYYQSDDFRLLSEGSKSGYRSRLERIRRDHGHRAVAGLTKERIEKKILAPFADKPGARIDTLKKLRILIHHAMGLKPPWLKSDPSDDIKRGKTKEIRAWKDSEMAAFEKRWPFGTKQRAAYELMLNVGTARADVHLTTWAQADHEEFEYTRKKTGVAVVVALAESLRQAMAALPRQHVCILTTAYGKPFSVDGFSGWMRDAIKAAGIADLSCRPHGLRKTLGRLMADAECTAHEIMAALGHTTLAEAERYTREADRRRGGRRAIAKLEDHRANKTPQTPSESLGKAAKNRGKSKREEAGWRAIQNKTANSYVIEIAV
jgi:integrase